MTSIREFALPDLGEGLTEAEIVQWMVEVGEEVAVDQPVVEVETAKASVEVPCPFAGVVTALHGTQGEVVEVGKPLLSVDLGEDGGSAGSGSGSGSAEAILVGSGGSDGPARRRRRVRIDTGAASAVVLETPPAEAPLPTAHVQSQSRSQNQDPIPVVSPLVRRLAREHGLDLRALTGTGPDGLILRADVESAVAVAERRRPETTETAVPTRIPLRGARRAAAEKFTRSHQEVPTATCWVDADATALLETRERLGAGAVDTPRIGLLALLARICVLALTRHPELNATVDVERSEIVRLPAVHLGVATQTDRGLLVPVVRDAQRMTTSGLAAAVARVTAAARAGTASPADLTGGTFTLNNYGVFGVDGSTPLLNTPESGMLGVGRIVRKPWEHQGELALRQVVQLSLTFDHRVCDGAVAGGFLRQVADCVEEPLELLRHT
jgi:pyruvate dehydrogenase E2 component (dihydrolipoamide acetyltransferase)